MITLLHGKLRKIKNDEVYIINIGNQFLIVLYPISLEDFAILVVDIDDKED